jgi:DNA-binding winged helix-turn-helix (wHTH) protein
METQNVYRIGEGFAIHPSENKLTRPEGSSQTVEPLLISIIIYLIAKSPAVATHDQLINEFWGPTVKGDEALMKAISKIRRLFPFQVIKTISKVGYQWATFVEKQNDKTRSMPLLSRIAIPKFKPVTLGLILMILIILKGILFPHSH